MIRCFSGIIGIVTLLCLCSSKGHAQSRTKALQYYQLVNNAELQICRKQPARSLQYYRQAFAINPDKPFSIDLYNAFHAAMDVRHYVEAEKYLARLLARGLGQQFIDNEVEGTYSASEKEKIRLMLTRHANDTLHNNELNQNIEQLIAIDQGMRHDQRYRQNEPVYMDSIPPIDDSIAHSLYRLFVDYGKMPNQDEVGNAGQNPYAGVNYFIIVLHHTRGYLRKIPFTLFDTMAYKAIFTWDYHPYWFIREFDNIESSHPDSSLHYGAETLRFPLTVMGYSYYTDNITQRTEYPRYYGAEKERLINTNRRKIGLCSLDEMREKFFFSRRERKNGTSYKKYRIDFGISPFAMTNSKEDIEPVFREMKKRGIKL